MKQPDTELVEEISQLKIENNEVVELQKLIEKQMVNL